MTTSGLPLSDQKNYSAEYGTRRNKTKQTAVLSEFRLFRGRKRPWNFVPNHFSEEKNTRNSIPKHFLEEKNPRKSVLNHFSEEKQPSEFRSEPFLDEQNLGIPFRTNFGREKTSGFRSKPILHNRKHSIVNSKPFLGTENTKKENTFVSCFVKVHYFAEFRSISFQAIRNGLFRNTQNHTD